MSTRTDTTSLSKTRRGACLTGVLTLSLLLVLATSALASGQPVNVGTPFEIDGLSVAVAPTGNAILAWADTKDLPPVTTNVVQYCVLPLNAVGCEFSGNLVPADGASYVDNVQVLEEGSTLVVLADVFGASGPNAEEYEPEQEWQSTDGGATFSTVDGGKSVADGILSADTEPLNAVTVPGSGVLGYGWDSAAGGEEPFQSAVPTFDAFPLNSPPTCSLSKGLKQFPPNCPSNEDFAALEPSSNSDPIGNPGGEFAAQSGAAAGVLGVFETNFRNGPLGCPGTGTEAFGTAFTYGAGDQSAANSYDISPGEVGSAWRTAVAQADCNVEYAAVDGGPSGFGVLEDDLATNQTVYHRFDQATQRFDTPLTTVAPEFEEQPSVSQDGSGNVYATYLAGFGGAIRLAYSGDAGNNWTSNTLNQDSDGGVDDMTSNVNAGGQGWVTWIDNGSVYAQSFLATDEPAPASGTTPISTPSPAPTSLTTSQTSGTTTGASITIPAGTVGESDTATITGANAASASGTVDFALYDNSSCSGTPTFAGAAHAADGTATIADDSSTGLLQGKYYWRASYSGNATNLPSASTCGSEVLTVTSAATIKGEGESTSTTVALNVSCATFPCTVTITPHRPRDGRGPRGAGGQEEKKQGRDRHPGQGHVHDPPASEADRAPVEGR